MHFQVTVRSSRFNYIALRVNSGRTTQIGQFASCAVAERHRAGSASTLVQVRYLFFASPRHEQQPWRLGSVVVILQGDAAPQRTDPAPSSVPASLSPELFTAMERLRNMRRRSSHR